MSSHYPELEQTLRKQTGGFVLVVCTQIISVIHTFYSQTVIIFYVYVVIKVNATSGAGSAYPSGAPEFTPGFWVGVTRSLVLYVCFVDRC